MRSKFDYYLPFMLLFHNPKSKIEIFPTSAFHYFSSDFRLPPSAFNLLPSAPFLITNNK